MVIATSICRKKSLSSCHYHLINSVDYDKADMSYDPHFICEETEVYQYYTAACKTRKCAWCGVGEEKCWLLSQKGRDDGRNDIRLASVLYEDGQ